MKRLASLSPYFRLARPRQWVKNVLVFTPAFFAGSLFAPASFGAAVVAFVTFSLAASAVYVFNDLQDLEEDRRHPHKKDRPLASGALSERDALVMLGVLVGLAFLATLLVPALTGIMLLYLGLNVLYSLFLKRVAIVDVAFVSSFYVLRVVAGGVATGVLLSPWIILATFFLALFLIIGKRRGEERLPMKRASLAEYAPQALDAMLLASAILAIASYSLWSVLVHPSSLAPYSVIPVTAVIFRMLNHLYRSPEVGERPEHAVFGDRWILALTVLWGLSMLALLYF
jgi:decaprenyl-phosphate phosphoribosyltransferase